MARIALVVLDTLRSDAFARHFDWLPGVRFENAWSTSNWTGPAHASLFTGRYPSEVGVRAGAIELDCQSPVLAERLRDAGYTTRAFSANSIVSREYQFGRGFEEFRGTWRDVPFNQSVPDFGAFASASDGLLQYPRAVLASFRPEHDTLASLKFGLQSVLQGRVRDYTPADDGAETALARLRNTTVGDDEFYFLNLMEAHGPYDPPAEYRTVDHDPTLPNGLEMALSDREYDRETIAGAYDDCVRYLSDVYRDIFAELRESFDYVVTVGDHGELLGEHGYWKHTYGLYPEITNVPLVVSDGSGRTERRDDVVNLLDVHATVLALAGLDAGDSRGRDLTGDLSSRPALLEYHGINLPWTRDRLTDLFPPETVRRHDEPLTAIAAPPSYYGYETPAGFVADGEATLEDPQQAMADLAADLSVPDAAGDGTEAGDSQVMDRLADLGYV